MENISEINQNIAKNLAYYRKAAGLTQAELAEKINYSDKSVSKWESGNGVPDVYILMQLAELYHITLNDLVGAETPQKAVEQKSEKKKTAGLHILIMLLSSGIVWLVATCVFVLMSLGFPENPNWLAFIYAVPVNAVVLIVYACVWKYRLLNFISISTLIWTVITGLFLTLEMVYWYYGADSGALWCLYLVGIPLQVLETLWAFFRSQAHKQKDQRKKKEDAEVSAQPDKQEQKGTGE